MLVHVVVLNYNGRHWLARCLPSVVRAARASRHDCRVLVLDNDSQDDSLAWLAEHFPEVGSVRSPNRGLCSFNEVVPKLPGRVAVLLNNDIRLDPESIDPLVEPLADSTSACFMTAPRCRRLDTADYEGFRTAVLWRFGLVQATALYPGHEATADLPGLTASAGAAMAVDRDKFAELGGFDPLYLPGRLEDLDFAYRGYQAGYHARYVPAAGAEHAGMGTFGAVFGPEGCDRLALRNTLLFQWKNLRHPLHVVREAVGLTLRLAAEAARAPATEKGRRWPLLRALGGAIGRLPQLRRDPFVGKSDLGREREFFRAFSPGRMRTPCNEPASGSVPDPEGEEASTP